MMFPPSVWRPIDEALSRAADLGRTIPFWWRDDDAITETRALERLLAVRAAYSPPLALAAIPARIERSLVDRLLATPYNVRLLVHGWRHENHATPPVKKSEFGSSRPLDVLTDDARQGLERIQNILEPLELDLLVKTFVPPWNRIADDLPGHLAALGYTGLSTYKNRLTRHPAPGLVQVNCHIDPIDWKAGKSLVPVDTLIAHIAGCIRDRIENGSDEPIGLLTHHLVHDETVWAFCEALLERLSIEQPGRIGVISWPRIETIFTP